MKFLLTSKIWMPYVVAALLATAFVSLYRRVYVCKNIEVEADCLYNIRISRQGPGVFCARRFPWTEQSVWREHFSDKELGFHFLLWGVMKAGDLLGAGENFPFHYQSAVLVLLMTGMFSLLLWRLKLNRAWLWCLLLISCMTCMTYRFMSIRAYVLSITISAGMIYVFLSPWFQKWRWWILFGFGCVETWCYSSPHLLLSTLLPCLAAEQVKSLDWRKAIGSIGCFLGGILVGLTLHPQFPNSFLIFKIQCIDVVLSVFFHQMKIPVRGGNEFYTTFPHMLWVNGRMFIVLTVALAVLVAVRWRRYFPAGKWRENVAFNLLFFTAIFNLLLSLCVYRFTEYALVPSVLLAAWLFNSLLEDFSGKKWPKVVAYGMVTCCMLYQTDMMDRLRRNPRGDRPCTDVAAWAARNHFPVGTVIANLNWGSFPYLYYAMPQYRFTWGLDPAFSWGYNPKMLNIVRGMVDGKCPDGDELRKVFNSKYVFIHNDELKLVELMEKKRFTLLYSGQDGWIYLLETNKPKRPKPVIRAKKIKLSGNI